MPRRLKHLVIDEVSSCDKGAGEGVRVVLTKRDTATADAIRNVIRPIVRGVVREFVKRKLEENRMSFEGFIKSNDEFALYEQRLAVTKFPESRSIGEALAKWHQTAEGQTLVNKYCEYYREQMAHRTAALSDVRKHKEIAVQHASNGKTDDAYEEGAPSIDKVNWCDDKEATKAYRAEKEYKRRREEIMADADREHDLQRTNSPDSSVSP